jgi:pimeloyl-ACP methyl ester carboxylesterase
LIGPPDVIGQRKRRPGRTGPGPRGGPVLAVGHSYGGAVITNAVPQTSNVVGLVYVAAFAPDEGETLAGIIGRSGDSILASAMLEYQYPTGLGAEMATELIIDPAKFREVFTADLPQPQSDVYALSQRPIAAGALGEETTTVAWKNLPTWAAAGTADLAAGSDVVFSMAQRADAAITEIEGSHVIMISQPDAVTAVIQRALTAVN